MQGDNSVITNLMRLARTIRRDILTATTHAGSGHPTSSLSAVELMAALFFHGFLRTEAPYTNPANDKIFFSKGHAAPLLYALCAAGEIIPRAELATLRRFDSVLEGHPTARFSFAPIATGSLGQGLSVGVGIALNAKYLDESPARAFVLLGDSELTEGSNWEAMQIAAYYRLNNLIGILDVNRLGQRGETMYGHDLNAYQQRIAAFGWHTIVIPDGHSFPEIIKAYEEAVRVADQPVMIIAKTLKGKGVSLLENQEGWHGKILSAPELEKALDEVDAPQDTAYGVIAKPERNIRALPPVSDAAPAIPPAHYAIGTAVATRAAYGNALARIFPAHPAIVALDAEVSNSTYANTFQKAHPKRFFEMFIAEQNMAGVALGLSASGKIPFVSSFAAFLTRAYDQIRMSQYSDANIKFVGSHAGVSIGEDGPSQMGLEDIAMFRTLLDSVVLYPADAVSTEKLVGSAAQHRGIVYLRTTRKETPVLYGADEKFPIGGSKTLQNSTRDVATVFAAGITLFEALKAYEALQQEGIAIRIIDTYSIKPIDHAAVRKAAQETGALISVEDHGPCGGLADAVRSCFEGMAMPPMISLAVRKIPRSGTPQELLDYEEISSASIIQSVKKIV